MLEHSRVVSISIWRRTTLTDVYSIVLGDQDGAGGKTWRRTWTTHTTSNRSGRVSIGLEGTKHAAHLIGMGSIVAGGGDVDVDGGACLNES